MLGYYAQTGEERFEFEELGDALAHARSLSHERALGGALRSGADNPQVVVEESSDGLDTFRVRAKAMGKPRLASGEDWTARLNHGGTGRAQRFLDSFSVISVSPRFFGFSMMV